MTPEKELPPDNKRMALSKAAELMGCDTSTMRRAIASGLLPAERYGRDWTVLWGDAKAWWSRPKHPGGKPRKEVIDK